MPLVDVNVKVEPENEIIFYGPAGGRIVTSYIKLTNPGTDKYYFKIKTTVPRSYCVKPSCGYIEPGTTVSVEVLLQKNSTGPPDTNNRHKFMILFIRVPDQENIDIDQLWKHPDTKVEDYKLKCVLKQPAEIVKIEPREDLIFEGPFTTPVTSFMKITNSSNSPVCFKIQTTTPKKYSVTPNFGFLEPQQVQHISVTLHQFNYQPNEIYKERFLVQYISTPDVDKYNETLWTEFYDKRVEYVLKSVYKMPLTAESMNEVDQLKSKIASLQESETRLRRITMETGNLQTGSPATHEPGFLANNAVLLIIVALILGLLAGKFFI